MTDVFPDDSCTALANCYPGMSVVWCPTNERDWDGHAVPGLADDAIWSFFSSAL